MYSCANPVGDGTLDVEPTLSSTGRARATPLTGPCHVIRRAARDWPQVLSIILLDLSYHHPIPSTLSIRVCVRETLRGVEPFVFVPL